MTVDFIFKASLRASLHSLEQNLGDPCLVVQDALRFLSLAPKNDFDGYISVDDNGEEIVLRWYNKKQWVNVHFDGSRHYEYAYLQDGKFVPGKEIGNLDKAIIPEDLKSYLEGFLNTANSPYLNLPVDRVES